MRFRVVVKIAVIKKVAAKKSTKKVVGKVVVAEPDLVEEPVEGKLNQHIQISISADLKLRSNSSCEEITRISS